MKTYRIYAAVTGTKYLGEVQASSEEEAKRKGSELRNAHVSLCWSCASEVEDPQISQFIADTDSVKASQEQEERA